MDAKIINISDNGDGGVIVRVVYIDNGNLLNFNNVFWQGQPCVEYKFPLPISSTNYVADLSASINLTIQNAIQTQLINRISTKALPTIASQLSNSLVGTAITVNTVSVGGVILDINNPLNPVPAPPVKTG
jgi:hypothetical protein